MSKKLDYQDLLLTDFFKFFNCKEIASKEEDSRIIKQVKTGGYQEYIDIEFHLNEAGELIEATLLLDRSWVGDHENLNPFAKDIAKSFVEVVAPVENKKDVQELVYRIFHQQGSKDRVITIRTPRDEYGVPPLEIKKILEVFKNQHPKMYYMLFTSMYTFENVEFDGKQFLSIVWKSL